MAFEASVANNQRYEDVNVTFPIEVSDPNVRQDVHSVSSLLKLYFRELPDPGSDFMLKIFSQSSQIFPHERN